MCILFGIFSYRKYTSHANGFAYGKETKMKIDADRLRALRQRKKLSRPDLERATKITVRTIQRLENEPDESKTTREDTVLRLANALEVEPGVLTGELDLPDAEKAPVAEPDPVRIGAQIAPKVRLAYDLIKRRYDVNVTDIINMAPLFFALLAEGSLAWRREKSEEAWEAFVGLEDIEGYWHGSFGSTYSVMEFGSAAEDDSIRKSDLFGEKLLDSPPGTFLDDGFFDPTIENPFATYLRKLGADLAIPGIVEVDGGALGFGSPENFPDYNINSDEINRISNDSTDARRALETGFARLSEIPEELMSEDKGEERQKWLEDRLAPIYKGPKSDVLARITAASPTGGDLRNLVKDAEPQTNTPETESEGDDQ